MVTHPVAPIPGDYRLYYAGVRDALLANLIPCPAGRMRVARLLDGCGKSAQRREIICD